MLKRAIILSVLPSMSLAASIEGTWATDHGQCIAGYAEGRLTIAGDSISFIESTCRLTQPTELRGLPQALLFDMACSGEGTDWTERILIGANGEDGLLIYARGFASTYIRC